MHLILGYEVNLQLHIKDKSGWIYLLPEQRSKISSKGTRSLCATSVFTEKLMFSLNGFRTKVDSN